MLQLVSCLCHVTTSCLGELRSTICLLSSPWAPFPKILVDPNSAHFWIISTEISMLMMFRLFFKFIGTDPNVSIYPHNHLCPHTPHFLNFSLQDLIRWWWWWWWWLLLLFLLFLLLKLLCKAVVYLLISFFRRLNTWSIANLLKRAIKQAQARTLLN